MAEPTPTVAPPLHVPDQAPDVHATHDLGRSKATGLQQLEALVHRHGHPTPATVAEPIAQHPHDKSHIISWLTQHAAFGNKFVTAVLAHGKPAAAAEHVNVDMGQLNKHNPGIKPGSPDDPNRLDPVNPDAAHPETAPHAHLAEATHVYRNDGTPYATDVAPVGQKVQLNAGGVKKIKLDGAETETACVMAFYIGPDAPVAKQDQHTTGWIPVARLDAAGKALAGIDATIAGELAGRHKHVGYARTAHTVRVVSPPKAYEHLRTGPHQTVGGTANLPEHYYGRPGDVANLLSNVPDSGGTRFGVAIDVLVAGTRFYKAEPELREHTQLWETGSFQMTDQKLEFVYGRAEDPTKQGEASYGWINVALLK